MVLSDPSARKHDTCLNNLVSVDVLFDDVKCAVVCSRVYVSEPYNTRHQSALRRDEFSCPGKSYGVRTVTPDCHGPEI